MNLNKPTVSRAIASLMKSLDRENRYELSNLTLEFTKLNELPDEWQDAIKAEMAKNAKKGEARKMISKAADGFVPPQAVRNNAKRGLELREKIS